MPIQQIHFERSGGMMGLPVTATVSLHDLPEETARQIIDLLDEVDFFDLPARLEAQEPGMDQFEYVLTVSRSNDDDAEPTGEHDTTEERSAFSRFVERLLPDEDEDEDRARPPLQTHTVTFGDTSAPPELARLARLLTRVARGQFPGQG
ncbi:MAG: hypothetical protein Kow0077_31810 [Anaerolineae bacterium]